MARIRADYPSSQPEWSTDSGSQIEPTTAEKATGWKVGDKVPARKLNWLLDAPNKWLKVAMASVFGNYTKSDYGSAVGYGGLCWSPSESVWVRLQSGGASGNAYYSRDGITWVLGAFQSTVIASNNSEHDYNGSVIYGGASGVVSGAADPTTGAFLDTSTGLTGNVKTLRTKDDDDYIIVADDNSQIAYATAYFQTYTVVSVTESFTDLIHIPGASSQTWLGLSNTGKIYRTTNDGATWALAGPGSPGAAATLVDSWETMDIDPISGIICCMGVYTANDRWFAVYSTDFGDTWAQTGSIPSANKEQDLSSPVRVRNLGGDVWIAGGGSTTKSGMLFSVDRLQTWQRMEVRAEIGTGGLNLVFALAGNDKRWMFGGNDTVWFGDNIPL